MAALIYKFARKFINRSERLANKLRIFRARALGVRVGRNVRIGRNVEFRFTQPSLQERRLVLGDDVTIDSGTILDTFGGSIAIATGTIVGPGCLIYGHGGITIGCYSLISPKCTILSSNHDFSQPHVRLRDLADVIAPTSIGDNCWLGSATCVMAGTTIGDDTIVAAGSIVTRDLTAMSVARGAPAKVVRSRLEDASTQATERSQPC